MPKTLSQRILARAKENEARRRAQHHAAFLAQREQIKQSLDDGWAILHIWETLRQEGKITTGYAAFCRRVRRSIPAHSAVMPRVSMTAEAMQRHRLNAPIVDGFNFESTPSEEDLL